MEEDVVKRLRRERGPVYGPLCQEAADEIERLRAGMNCDECWNKGYEAGLGVSQREIERLLGVSQREIERLRAALGVQLMKAGYLKSELYSPRSLRRWA
jgi:hypothetical protein